jgi:putative flippase GtrA
MESLKKLFGQGIKFAMVGAVNTLVDWGVYFLLRLTPFFAVHYLPAQAISYTCGVINSLFMNKNFTFREKGKMGAKRVLAFFAVNLISLVVSMAVLFIFKEKLLMNDLISKGAAVVFSMGVNFVLNKLLVFKGL